jgi:hypothetical protein
MLRTVHKSINYYQADNASARVDVQAVGEPHRSLAAKVDDERATVGMDQVLRKQDPISIIKGNGLGGTLFVVDHNTINMPTPGVSNLLGGYVCRKY